MPTDFELAEQASVSKFQQQQQSKPLPIPGTFEAAEETAVAAKAAQEASFAQAEERGVELQQIEDLSDAELADKDPLGIFNRHSQYLSDAQQKKLKAAYKKQRTSLSPTRAAGAVEGAGGTVASLVRGVATLNDYTKSYPLDRAADIYRKLTGEVQSPESELAEINRGVSAGVAIEQGLQSTVDIGRKAIRQVAQRLPSALPGPAGMVAEDVLPKPSADVADLGNFLTPEDEDRRFYNDAAQRKQQEAVLAGKGENFKNFAEVNYGLTPEVMEQIGVEVDQEVVADLGNLASPLNAIQLPMAAGGGYALATSGGKVVARASTTEALTKLAGKLGKKLEAGGKYSADALATFSKGRTGLAGSVLGIAASGATGGATGLVAGIAAPIAGRLAGKAAQAAGKALQKEAAVRPALGFVTGLAKAGAAGAKIGAPFAIGSDTPEEALMVAGSAAAISSAAFGAGAAGKVAGQVAGAELVKRTWNERYAGNKDVTDAGALGKDAGLDTANAAALDAAAEINPRVGNIAKQMRNDFRTSGSEFYLVLPDEYSARVGADMDAKRAIPDSFEGRMTPDEFAAYRKGAMESEGVYVPTTEGASRILVKFDPATGEAPAITHEPGHLYYRAASPELRAKLDAEALKLVSTPEKEAAAWDYYKARLGDKTQYSPEVARAKLLEEIASDTLGAIRNAAPLENVPPSFLRSSMATMAETLAQLGLYDSDLGSSAPKTPFFQFKLPPDMAGRVEGYIRELQTEAGKAPRQTGAPKPPATPPPLPAETAHVTRVREALRKIDAGEALTAEEQQFMRDMALVGSSAAVEAQRALVAKLQRGEQLTPEEVQANTEFQEAGRRIAEANKQPVPPVQPAEAAAPAAAAATPPPLPGITGTSIRGITEKTAGERFSGSDRAQVVADMNDAAAKIASDPSLTPEQKEANKLVLGNQGRNLSLVYDSATPRYPGEAIDYAKWEITVEKARNRPDLRSIAPKFGFSPKKVEILKDGSVQIVGFDGEAVLVNIDNLLDQADTPEKRALIPYFDEASKKTGLLTEEAAKRLHQDIVDYTNNQDNGYLGNGEKLKRTPGYKGPAENPNHVAVKIPEDRAQFANAVMGEQPPLTSRAPAKGKTPVPFQAAQVRRAQGVQDPEGFTFRGKRYKGPGEFAGFEIRENLALRDKMRKAGFDFGVLKPASTRLLARRILKAELTPGKLKPNVSVLTAAGFMPKAEDARFMPGKSLEVNQGARELEAEYMKRAGRANKPFTGYAPLDEKVGKQVADFYERAKDTPNDPEVKAAYDAFAKETKAQWDFLTENGILMEPWTGEGQPYEDSAGMRADVKNNNHLWFFPTEAGYGSSQQGMAHPLLADSGVVVNGKKLVFNDLFRAVHDYFGHAKEGYEFGPRGELNAFLAHSRMFSEAANPAMAAETMGQNSWVNFGSHLRDAAGNVPKKGEPGYVPVTERPYAEQKALVLKPTADMQFMPARTKAGKEWEDGGFMFINQRNPATDTHTLRLVDPDSNEQIGFIQYAYEGNEAKVMMTAVPKEVQGKGIGETLYREMLTHLQKEGVTELGGEVVHPAPMKIREKLLGKPVIEDAVEGIQERAVLSVRNKIDPAMRFMPTAGEGPTLAARVKPTEGTAKAEYDALVEKFKTAKGQEKFDLWQQIEKLKNETGGTKAAGQEGPEAAATEAISDAQFMPKRRVAVVARGKTFIGDDMNEVVKKMSDAFDDFFGYGTLDKWFEDGTAEEGLATKGKVLKDSDRPGAKAAREGKPLDIYHFGYKEDDFTETDPKQFVQTKWWGKRPKTFFWAEGSQHPVSEGAGNDYFESAKLWRGTVSGKKIYNGTGSDPLGFFQHWKSNPDKAEGLIAKAGYDGFVLPTKDDREVVVMFKPVKVKVVGTTDYRGFIRRNAAYMPKQGEARFMAKPQQREMVELLASLRNQVDPLTGRASVITKDNPISNQQEEVQRRNPAPDARAALAYFATKEGIKGLKSGTVETDRRLATSTEGAKFEKADRQVAKFLTLTPELFAEEAAAANLPEEVIAALARVRAAIPVLDAKSYNKLSKLPTVGAGSESVVKRSADAVYKLADDSEQPGFRMDTPEQGAGGGVGLRMSRGGLVDLISRVARNNMFEGNVPTEIVGFTPRGRVVLKQPYLPETASQADVAAWQQTFGHRAPAATEVTPGSSRFNRRSVLNQPILKDPYGNSYLTGDAREVNFRKTEDGEVYATDILVRPVLDSDVRSVPALERFAPRDVEAMRFMPRQQKEMALFKRRNKTEQREDFSEAVVPRDKDAIIPSDILGSPRYKEAKDRDAAIKSFKRVLIKKYNKYKDLPETKLGRRWYEDFTPLLKEYFGEDAQVFAELLAATSPQMNPSQNFDSALEAYRRFKVGDYDQILSKFNEGLDKISSGEATADYMKDREVALAKGAPVRLWSEEPTPEGLTGWWIAKHNLLPRKEAHYDNKGKNVVEPLFGHSSKSVLWVIARKWFNENRGPKTRQFVQNLLGEDHGATIDLWADRTMREAGYKDYQDRWRILPENKDGVSDADFAFAQEVFAAAADDLGMKPSALQGALWFVEKKIWAENGWSPLDLGSFITEINRLKAFNPTKDSLFKPRPKLQVTGDLFNP